MTTHAVGRRPVAYAGSDSMVNSSIVFGSGPLGLWVARTLSGQGKRVTIVNRSGKVGKEIPERVKVIGADASDSAVVYNICKDADVVFHCAMPPYTQWPEKFPPLTDGIAEGVKRAGCRLVFGDNLYAYGDTSGAPLYESLPYRATGSKGNVRASMAERLLNDPDLEVVIGRGSDFYGPLVRNALLGERFFNAAMSGRKVDLLGDVDLPHTYTYIKDFARALVNLGDDRDAFGQVWHVPNAPTVSTRQLVSIVGKKIGKPIKIRTSGRFMIALLGLFIPMMKGMPIEMRVTPLRLIESMERLQSQLSKMI